MNLTEKEHKFKAHYKEWAQRLFRFIYFKSKNPRLAQDIVQDASVKYWDKMDTIAMELIFISKKEITEKFNVGAGFNK